MLSALRYPGLTSALLLAGATLVAAEPIHLTPNPEAWTEAVRVEARLRLEGEVTPEAIEGGEATTRPVAAELRLAYRQEGLQPDGEAVARVIRVVEGPTAEGLREDRRTLVATSDPLGARTAAVGGPLTRAELDRVQLPADPLDLDGLLPAEPTRDGGTWKIDSAAIGRLLRVKADTLCEVTGLVSQVTPTHAKIRFAGPVHGHAEGAEIEIELRGVALFDRTRARLTQVNLGWKESRKLGPATPAIEATAKLNLAIEPADEAGQIAVTDLLMAETAKLDERLELATADGAWRLLGDRQWYVVAADRRATTLRRVENGRLTAVTSLTPASRRGMNAEDLEREVRYSLGEQLQQVTSTERGVTPSGLTVESIASVGLVDKRPTEWRHHLIHGDAATLTATTTLPSLDGPADDTAVRRLISSISAGPAQAETAAAGATAVRR